MTNTEVLAEIQRMLIIRTDDDTCVERIHDLIQRRYKEVRDEMFKQSRAEQAASSVKGI